MKKQKNKLLLLAMTGALAMAVTVSCEKESAEYEKDRMAVVEFRFDELSNMMNSLSLSKANGEKHNNAAYDTVKNTLLFFVFNKNEQLQVYKSLAGPSAKNPSQMKVEVTPGIKQIMVIANSHQTDSLKNITTLSEFSQKTSKLAKENVSDFTMVGRLDDFDVQFNPNENTIANVTLKRMVARVHLGTIKTQFTGGFADSTLNDVKVYLINYYSKADYISMSGVENSMLNKDSLRVNDAAGMAMSNIDRCTVGTVGSEAVTVDQYFYMYGNDLRENKKTRLVIEGKLGGYTYYYPIDLHDENSNVLSANNSFDIKDVTISRPGIDDPDGNIEKGTLWFRLTTEDWIARDTTGIVF